MSKRLFNETRFTTAEMLVAATVLSVALLLAPSMASAADLVSVSSEGIIGDNSSFSPVVISADGRFVVFPSEARNLSNLVDDNGTTDIFVRDLDEGTTTLVSVNSDGTASGNRRSGSPTISADGRFVAFQSSANDLVAGDKPRPPPLLDTDVFVRDLQKRTTTLLSVNSAGTGSGNDRSGSPVSSPVISADGRFVAFESEASDLVPPGTDTNDKTDIFVWDRQTGTTTLVSVNSSGSNSGDDASFGAVISADGLSVAFVSFASNLVATDTNERSDIFVRTGGTTTLVSVNTSGGDSGNGFSGDPVISPDGRSVAFSSSSDKLVAKDTNRNRDVFVRAEGTTTLVSVLGTDSANRRSDSPDISADGRFVAFRSFASNLASADTDPNGDVFVRDLQEGTTTLLSVNSAGTGSGNGSSDVPVISADGKVVAFRSFASNLVGTDNNGVADVFVSVVGQEEPAVALIIDQDSIDNGSPPNFFSDMDVNDHIAKVGLRDQLRFFADPVDETITLHTGDVGDEGWFALKTIPDSWADAGPTDDGLRNYIVAGPGLGTGEALLGKIPDVTPLRATGLKLLEGRKVCAVVYDSDISINYAPLNGNLKGATLGTVAFEVMSVTELTGFSPSSLPQVEIKILDAEDVCKGQLTVF